MTDYEYPFIEVAPGHRVGMRRPKEHHHRSPYVRMFCTCGETSGPILKAEDRRQWREQHGKNAPEENQLEEFDEADHVADDIWDELPPEFKHPPLTPESQDYPDWLMQVAAHVASNAERRRYERSPQICPSMAYMVRDADNALVAYQCARPFGHSDDRPHRNGIASDAGSWTTEQAMESLDYVLALLRDES